MGRFFTIVFIGPRNIFSLFLPSSIARQYSQISQPFQYLQYSLTNFEADKVCHQHTRFLMKSVFPETLRSSDFRGMKPKKVNCR